jgi:succinylglutamate desuccinylase
VPDVIADVGKRNLAAWLGGAGIEAIIMNSKSAPTFSAYTATRFGATSCTAELGQVGKLGENDLSQFAITSAAIDTMLRSGDTLPFRNVMPHVFQVAQEVVKRSNEFQLNFDRSTENFTPMQPGELIATDGTERYCVGPVTEHVVFPNPDVRIGQRAGLMVVRRTPTTNS